MFNKLSYVDGICSVLKCPFHILKILSSLDFCFCSKMDFHLCYPDNTSNWLSASFARLSAFTLSSRGIQIKLTCSKDWARAFISSMKPYKFKRDIPELMALTSKMNRIQTSLLCSWPFGFFFGLFQVEIIEHRAIPLSS